jgi:hypothetical protein
VFDGAIFAGGVHGLEDEEQRPFVLGIEPVLEIAEEIDAGGEGFFGAGFVFVAELQCVAGIEIFQAKVFAVINPERVGDLVHGFEDLFCFHGLFFPVGTPLLKERVRPRAQQHPPAPARQSVLQPSFESWLAAPEDGRAPVAINTTTERGPAR